MREGRLEHAAGPARELGDAVTWIMTERDETMKSRPEGTMEYAGAIRPEHQGCSRSRIADGSVSVPVR